MGDAMKSRYLCLALLLLLICTLLPTSIVLADTGPKPSMGFTFTGEPVAIVSGILYECDQSDCSDAAPLEELGPQGFYCDAESCSAIAYGFARYHKIEIEFSDGSIRQSNVFETAGFDSEYTVTVRPDDLLVEAEFNLSANPRTSILLIVCGCILIMGLIIIAGVVFFLRRRATS
jgi:hypothetical protein